MHEYRTHTCGELRRHHAGLRVRLSGWVFRKRDHGSLLFVDLRDHYGVTQVVVRPERPFFEGFQKLRLESVVTVTGWVEQRTPDTVNPGLATGEIEVVAEELVVRSVADVLPIQVAAEEDAPEEVRLKYRFLDLRRERLHRNIVLRSRLMASLRQRMMALGFAEFQTPILTSSSPEGARDYLVPSRLHPGYFYALPQAPQIFKQLLMVAGFDRYFQIAPCFRDEDARADRSPGEFYQLDLEMSFATQDDIFAVVEDVVSGVFEEFSGCSVERPFPRLRYKDALLRYGTDKPDLRIPLQIVDMTGVFQESGFKTFREIAATGGVIRALPVRAVADRPRSFFDRLVEQAKVLGSKGLAYIVWEGEDAKGPVVKFLTEREREAVRQAGGVNAGDAVFFVAGPESEATRIAGGLRVRMGQELGLVEPHGYRFCWITDFPMFEVDEETGRLTFSHNPFSMPQGGLEALMTQDPLSVLAYQYDLVCNGVELSSGAIRNHRLDVMFKAFEMVGYSAAEVERKFPALVNAFRYGPPPHGGIAPGIDRMVMLLARESNLREVVAFPMNQRAQDVMMGAPSAVTERQLRDLHIRVDLPKPDAPLASH